MHSGFKSLETLPAKAINVGDEVIEYFLSNCPLFERLSLYQNHALRNLKVVGSSLMLRWYLGVVIWWSVETIDSLRSVTQTLFHSPIYAGGDDPKMVIKNTP